MHATNVHIRDISNTDTYYTNLATLYAVATEITD